MLLLQEIASRFLFIFVMFHYSCVDLGYTDFKGISGVFWHESTQNTNLTPGAVPVGARGQDRPRLACRWYIAWLFELRQFYVSQKCQKY